jgi:hypothetical protein
LPVLTEKNWCRLERGGFVLKKAKDNWLRGTTRRRLGLVLPSAEGEEIFIAGIKIFWFQEASYLERLFCDFNKYDRVAVCRTNTTKSLSGYRRRRA